MAAAPRSAKLAVAVVIGLVAIGVIVGGLYWLGNRGPSGDGNDIITAERGDYKQRPENPGGMNLSGEGNTSVAASEGQQPQRQSQPERRRRATGPARTRPAGAGPTGAADGPARASEPAGAGARPASPPGAATAAAPGPGRGPEWSGDPARRLLDPAAANSAWTALAGRFRYLAPLSHNVVPVQAGGRTLHRLRASGPGQRHHLPPPAGRGRGLRPGSVRQKTLTLPSPQAGEG